MSTNKLDEPHPTQVPSHLRLALIFAALLTGLASVYYLLAIANPKFMSGQLKPFFAPLHTSPASIAALQSPHIFAPNLRKESAMHANRTLFIFGEDCMFMFNYVCKFWYYMRCHLFAMFPNVRVLGHKEKDIQVWMNESRPGDVVIISYRYPVHELTPVVLERLLEWRDEAHQNGDGRAVNRIGIFHIANEKIRFNWPWYTRSDFILRNYWTKWIPRHVMYIPLGGQVPNTCPSEKSSTSFNFKVDERDACVCSSIRLKSAYRRQYLWSFIGSLRRSRRNLVEDLRKSTIINQGFLHVAHKFGGDGVVGKTEEDPKNMYLKAVQDSQFVFCPCGNVMETHRIYEALNLGAIPVIEYCSKEEDGFFPIRELVVHGGSKGMIKFVESYAGDTRRVEELRGRVMSWWKGYVTDLAINVSRTIMTEVPMDLRANLRR